MKLLEVSEEDLRLITILLGNRDKYNRNAINTSVHQSIINGCAEEHTRINLLLGRINKLREAKEGKFATPEDIAKTEAKEVAEAKPKSKGIDINIVLNDVEDLAPLLGMLVNHG
ncbi:hypothetical protein [Clostridium perfringens]|uniref:hypothetical protein n=1 Tax=Clostridium perfringens TaxID=1502 RepID=UPI00232BBF16|nr:hypothetical protein [Clostridium perfringens]MDB2049601.1 hypothetical protein [Clostridium perfringens]